MLRLSLLARFGSPPPLHLFYEYVSHTEKDVFPFRGSTAVRSFLPLPLFADTHELSLSGLSAIISRLPLTVDQASTSFDLLLDSNT